MKPAKRIERLPAYLFAKLEEKATEMKARGIDLIDLGIADPDLTPPDFMIESVKRHMHDPGAHQYPTSRGDIEVRAAIANWFLRRFNVKVNPANEIAVTMGSKEGLANISRAYINAGDVVGCPDPGYPVYSNAAAILNDGMVRSIPLRPENGFLPDLSLAVGCKILYLNYPNNPTGAVAPESFYIDVAKFAEKHPETLVIWDAAYCELVFGGFRPPSILNYTRKAIEFHSLSKMMNVTGYRIGFAVGNSEAVDMLVKVKTQLDSGAPVFIQRAMADALGLYNGPIPPRQCIESHSEYGLRKQLIEKGFKTITGVEEVYGSPATFFMWAKVGDDIQFVEDALELGVILTPGSGFGENGKGFVRAAVTAPYDKIEEAINRLGGDIPKREVVTPLAYPTSDEANAVIELLDENSISEIETDSEIRIIDKTKNEIESSDSAELVEDKFEDIEDSVEELSEAQEDDDVIEQLLHTDENIDNELPLESQEDIDEEIIQENTVDESEEEIEDTFEPEQEPEFEPMEITSDNQNEIEFETGHEVDDLLGIDDTEDEVEPEPEIENEEQLENTRFADLYGELDDTNDDVSINSDLKESDIISEIIDEEDDNRDTDIEELEDHKDIMEEILDLHSVSIEDIEKTINEDNEKPQFRESVDFPGVQSDKTEDDVLDIPEPEVLVDDDPIEAPEAPELFTTISDDKDEEEFEKVEEKKAEIVDDITNDFVSLADYEAKQEETLKATVEEVVESEEADEKKIEMGDINEISSDQVLEIFDELDEDKRNQNDDEENDDWQERRDEL